MFWRDIDSNVCTSMIISTARARARIKPRLKKRFLLSPPSKPFDVIAFAIFAVVPCTTNCVRIQIVNTKKLLRHPRVAIQQYATDARKKRISSFLVNICSLPNFKLTGADTQTPDKFYAALCTILYVSYLKTTAPRHQSRRQVRHFNTLVETQLRQDST